MPHGGIIYFNSPVECFLNIKTPLPPKAAHIPMSRLLILGTKSLRISDTAPNFPLMQPFLTNHLT